MKKILNFKFSFSLVCALFATLSMNAYEINHDISSGCLIIPANSNYDYVITGSTSNTNNYVEVQFGYKGTITLSNCYFNFTSSGVHSPIRICGKNNLSNTDYSRTNVNIILEGDNYIYNSGSGRACIQVDQGAQINISAIEPCDNSSGTLTAIQKNTSGGAAIGSLDHYSNTNETTATVLLSNGRTGITAGGNVVISSGTVTAKGGHGAGIGGGYGTYYDGMIVIYGGIVDATAIYHAAGIGSGCPRGTGVVTEYAPNSAIVAIPPAVISAKGAAGHSSSSELGLAGTKVRIYIGDPAKPNIKVYTEDYIPDANVYVDLSQDPDIERVITTTVNASLLDINQVLFGSTDASGIYSTTGQLQNNTTFFTDATSKSAAALGRPYLPTTTALPNGGEVKLNLLEANFTIKNFGAKILETSYTEQQAADSATCIKITYNDNIPITGLSFDFANGSSTDFCQPIFLDSDSLTVIPAPTSFQNGDIYYVTIPIQNSKPSKVYSDVLRIIGEWNGVSTSYIRQIISQIVASVHTEYICDGDSYLFHDQLLTEPGQYTNVTSSSGCNPESEVELLYLTVNPTYDSLIIDTICQWDSYLQNGFVFDSMPAGNYFDTLFLNTIYGCDSIVKLNLTVNPTYDSLIIDTICQWDSYLQNGFVFDSMSAGNYFDTLFLNTIYGCDSIVKLNLTVNPTYDSLIYDTICQGDSYIQNSFVFNSMPAGNYFDTLFLNTIYGCDSVVKLNLTVNPTYDSLIIDTICQWDSYLQNGFVFDSMPAGNYFDTLFLNTIYGCDSIVKLNLTVNPTYDSLIYDTICQGDSYIQNGFVFNSMPAGNYFDTLFLNTIYGCDSIVKLNLFVRPSFDTLIFDTICYGDNYLGNNFNIIAPPSGLYQDTLFLNTIYGCDSIVKLNLTVNPSYDIEINENICQGEDYIENGFVFEDMVPGNYFDTLFLNTINGCDSIVKLNLTVNPSYEIEINDVACQGDDYLENGFVIESLQNGTYSESLFLNSIYGCDSIVKLNLTVNESFHFEIYDSICYGEDYTMYGLNLTQLNVGIDNYTSNLQTIHGCDSIFDVTLKVLDVYDEIIIDGKQVLLVSTNLTTGCYLYTVGKNEEDRTYSWEIDNEDWKIAPNNNECLVWATTPKKCTLTVSCSNSCGTVSDAIELTADFFDEVNTSKVMMYPNPARNYINIKHNDISRINVYDSYGQLILRNEYNLDSQVKLNLNSLESSIYILEIITPERTFIERISIIK